MRANHQIFLWVFVALSVGAFNFLTMPNQIYPGDSNAIRVVATHLVANGTLGVPYSERSKYEDFLEVKERYFHENDERQMFYSRWEELNTLLFAIPEAIRQPANAEYSE